MLDFVEFLVSLALMFIILLRLPEETLGLQSFATNDALGSPRTTQRFINRLIGVLVFIYFGIAIHLTCFTP